MTSHFDRRAALSAKFRARERLFGCWVSFAHPSIAETFARAGFDFTVVDMEHSTISVEQAQRIIAACQSEGVPCLPRPVSHSNDFIKPLLDAGADGLLIQMVNTTADVETLIQLVKYPPLGNRSYGVSRAHGYGWDVDEYIHSWNRHSSFLIQVESVLAVENIDALLQFDEVDGVMLGPYDLSASFGVPGQPGHPKVAEASRRVIEACARHGKSCGAQVSESSEAGVQSFWDLGYTFAILGSDSSVLWKWSQQMRTVMGRVR